MAALDLPVLGMTCAACVRRVEKAIGRVEGVAGVDVNLALSRARIEGTAAAAAVMAAVKEAGYEVPADALEPERRVAAVERARAEEVGGLRRDAAIAFALAVPLVVLGMLDVARVAQAVLGTIIVVGPGRRYWIAGARAVAHRAPDMNTLIALGVLAAWGASIAALVRGGGATYFEAAGAIVAFVLLGKVLEARVREKLVGVARGLVELTPVHAHRADGSDVLASALVPGDVMMVKQGERLAADGTVVGGSATVDESLLTGESMPVDKREGSPVYAGTLAQVGTLEVRVARAGDTTALARIARAVEDAQSNKAAIARLADRVSAVFVPVVLALGAATFLAWWLAGGAAPDLALERAVAVLVIACPCALGLATPAAIAVGTARAAELGVLFRGGTALEAASDIAVIAMDKTGTLTAGKPAVISGFRLPASGFRLEDMLAFAAAAELASEHPIARAIVDAAREKGLAIAKPTKVEVAPGGGITAIVDGREVKIGSAEFIGVEPVESPHTICFVAIDCVVAGHLAVADPVRPEARATVDALRALGLDVVMITGDREGPAHDIAAQVGITEIHANVRPTEKAALIASLRSGSPKSQVAMVGDGLNDAPALAAADLGIALASGTDLAAAAADLTIFRGGLANVPTAIVLARATLHTIRRNLYAAFLYNAICIPIAAAGWLSPMYAAAAMSLSSVSVLISSLRLRRVRPPGS